MVKILPSNSCQATMFKKKSLTHSKWCVSTKAYLVEQHVLCRAEVEALLVALVLQDGACQVIRHLHVAAVELSSVLRGVKQQRRRLLNVSGVHQRRVTRQTLRLRT